MLASQPDQSVVIVVVGQETNISRLLKSNADEYSNLNGGDLVRKKVKCISIMGGHFGSNAFPEWNIKTDLESAQLVFSLCPVPVIASGYEIGDALLYPHTSIQNDFSDPGKNPLCVSYCNWGHMPYNRQTWDLTSVFVAVEPGEEYFSYSPYGTITIDSEGNSVFTQNEKGKHRYLILDSSNAENVVNKLVRVVTGK
jgi:inosine-uridine nucleoside N-ribohydrolase